MTTTTTTVQGWLEDRDQAKVQVGIAKLGADWVARHNGDPYFALWAKLVDLQLTRSLGVGLYDLADWCIYDAYADGFTPREGAQEAVDNDDTFADVVGLLR